MTHPTISDIDLLSDYKIELDFLGLNTQSQKEKELTSIFNCMPQYLTDDSLKVFQELKPLDVEQLAQNNKVEIKS